MEGLYFYGFVWSVWIVMTFLIKKQVKYRLPLACFTLIGITISPFYFKIGNISISYISIFILLAIFIRVGFFSFKNKSYFFICSLIIAIGYGAFLLLELFDPIWVIFKREWLLAFLVSFLSVLLQDKLPWRLTIVLTGPIYGDILFAIVIKQFSFPYLIGSMEMLDVCSLAAMIILSWEGIKILITYFEHLYQSIEKGKQKTT
ncbi:YphA family membrane protein [Pseudoneobacillus sp. C159]